MIGRTISHYRILEKLGAGGMGMVYKARDTKLDRTVALKFLPPALTRDDEARARLVHEAKAAAALSHPNICTIYEIDQAGEHLFIAMEYVGGQSLEARMAAGSMELEEIVDVSLQIAQGLKVAHAKGVVHRDIKPANVMLTAKGTVKIMDFGLARTDDQTALTDPDPLQGTVAYISPEQASGGKGEQRSDLWSLGVVIYRMIAGQAPFRGDSEMAVLHAIQNTEPEAVVALRPDVPAGWQDVIYRALAKDPAGRYQSAAAMIEDLSRLKTGDRRTLPARSRGDSGRAAYVAVLPFQDMSPQQDQEYFCDGIAEEILTSLSRLEGLQVASRTSSFSFKGQSEDVRRIGLKLGVQALVEGSVRKSGERLRITVQMIDVTGGFQIWSERFDRQLEDVFEIQEEIARKVVETLAVKFGPGEKGKVLDKLTSDVGAYEYYLKARQYLYRQNRRSLQFARQLFSRAAEVDPGFALAFAGLSDACCLICMWYERSEDLLTAADMASRRALELAPDRAQAHASRGLALAFNRHYEEAEREFEIAVDLDARLFEVWYFYGRCQVLQGKLADAAEHFQRAHRAQPEDFQSLFLASQALRALGRDEEAAAVSRRALEVAERHLEFNPEDTRALYLGAAAWVTLGEKERGLEWARRAVEVDPEDAGMLYNLACIYCLAGELEQAISMLERWEQNGAVHKEWLLNDPDLAALRDSARFRSLVERLP